ncbi:hypothetical protein [Streptomyces sp. NBC_00134]|uniref:hypothetical protein n=1 Tax=Streptomyces sp. NBC_00134 TaxID=2975663 RepID=UPI00325510E9
MSEAFRAGGPVPSDTTVAALARALKSRWTNSFFPNLVVAESLPDRLINERPRLPPQQAPQNGS